MLNKEPYEMQGVRNRNLFIFYNCLTCITFSLGSEQSHQNLGTK